MQYAPEMSRLHFFGWLFFALAVYPLNGADVAVYQKTAAAALQFEIAQIGKDCGKAQTTLEINSCLLSVAEKTESNFRALYGSLRSLLNTEPETARQLDDSEAQWVKYSTSACDAVDSFYSSGSIRVAAVTGCRIQLTRSRMQDLNALYFSVLHL